ncbi:ABC transporter ATP-binding protein [Candidatus Bipolaricaulota bacterium]|nr:ABC transporter ATP-binding protein [Candidatus Bipolaricaulota bacterium]
MADQRVIEVSDLTFSYRKTEALKKISFTVDRGEVLGFLGPNGAGKSTTVKLLTGQIVPDKGSIRILDRPMPRERSRILNKIGLCFEAPNIYPKLTGFENLAIFAKLHGQSTSHIPRLMSRFGLENKGNQRVASYSKGMKQRLVVARALVNRPEILILDEPTQGLDPTNKEMLHELFHEQQEVGTTIFITTHDMLDVEAMCDRVIFLNEGSIMADDDPKALMRRHGKALIHVSLKNTDGVEAVTLPIDEAKTADRIADWLREGRVETIHSQEATLGQVFINITGRRLDHE